MAKAYSSAAYYRRKAKKSAEERTDRILKQLFGEKGEPDTIENALKATNPNFAKGWEYWHNCQRCVAAYELRRRGYDVEAKQRLKNDPFGGAWDDFMVGMRGRYVNMPSRGTADKMAGQMAEWGDGARAVVYVKWKGKKSSHVFIAEQVGEHTHFIDPQSGKHIDIGYYMDHAVKNKTRLYRVDDLRPNTVVVEQYVQKRS